VHLVEVWTVAGGEPLEQAWCQQLARVPGLSLPVPGFGASDSPCVSHLLYTAAAPHLRTLSTTLFASLAQTHCQPEILHVNITFLSG